MSVINSLAENYSIFHKTLMFFMRLAWRSRITLPYLVMIGFMVLNVRLTLEIIIDVEHQPPDDSGRAQIREEEEEEEEVEDDDADDDAAGSNIDEESLSSVFEE